MTPRGIDSASRASEHAMRFARAMRDAGYGLERALRSFIGRAMFRKPHWTHVDGRTNSTNPSKKVIYTQQ